MRKNAEAFFAVDLKQKTNHRRENSFPSDIRILLVMVMLHRHACFRAVWFRSSPLIYQASLYLEAGPYCWLHVLVLKKSENHQQKIKIHNNVIKKTKEWRGSNKKLSVTLDHHQKLVFDECLRYFQMGSQQIEFNHKYTFKKTSTTYKSHSINKKKTISKYVLWIT